MTTQWAAHCWFPNLGTLETRINHVPAVIGRIQIAIHPAIRTATMQLLRDTDISQVNVEITRTCAWFAHFWYRLDKLEVLLGKEEILLYIL